MCRKYILFIVSLSICVIYVKKQQLEFFFLLLLVDVERYSDKYQNVEPSDNTIEWSPGNTFYLRMLFTMIGMDVQCELRLHRC